jgi:8-oxo-dGTP pyrophosphatase MutT (NUDIX family)
VYEAASREAMEEAGVKGIVNVTSSFTISSLA